MRNFLHTIFMARDFPYSGVRLRQENTSGLNLREKIERGAKSLKEGTLKGRNGLSLSVP